MGSFFIPPSKPSSSTQSLSLLFCGNVIVVIDHGTKIIRENGRNCRCTAMVKKKLVYIDLFAFSILYHDFFSQIVYVTSKKVNVAHLKKKCCDRFENRKIDQTISNFFLVASLRSYMKPPTMCP